MTLREAIEQVIKDAPETFSSREVISVYRNKAYKAGMDDNQRLGRDIKEIVDSCAGIPYEHQGGGTYRRIR